MNSSILITTLLTFTISMVAQVADPRSIIPAANKSFLDNLGLPRGAAVDGARVLSDPDARKPLSEVAPEKVWEMLENTELLPEGVLSIEKFVLLGKLLTAIQTHPKNSEFVDLMLKKIAKASLPTHKPKDWNEILIVGQGGTAGLLITRVAKIARPTDCQRIVDAIFATKDAAKIAKLREVIVHADAKEEFTKLLKEKSADLDAKGKGQ